MARITLRLDDRMAGELRELARRKSQSVNALLVSLVDAVLEPGPGCRTSTYERLLRAGLIEQARDTALPASPTDEAVTRARAALMGVRLASDLVIAERG